MMRWLGRLPPRGHPRLALMALAVAAVAVAWGPRFSFLGRPAKNLAMSCSSASTPAAPTTWVATATRPNSRRTRCAGRDGVRFTSVITPFPMTLPAHCSMLTGTYPKTHGVAAATAPSGRAARRWPRSCGVRAIRRRFVGGFPISARFGLGQGFDTYDDRLPKGGPGLEPERKAEEVSRRGMEWLEEHGGQPFFLFLHYYDPHFPYDPPPPYPPNYDGELAYVDLWIGKVMEKLHALGLDADTLVVLAGDHGEGLGEHGETEHGFLLYQNTLSVPLIVRPPAGGPTGNRVDENVSLVDVMPTVLGLLGLSIPRQVQGVDLSGFCGAGVPPAAGKSPSAWATADLQRNALAGTCTIATPCTAFSRAGGSTSSPEGRSFTTSAATGQRRTISSTKSRRVRATCATAWKTCGRRCPLPPIRPAAPSLPSDKDTLRRLESAGIYRRRRGGAERLDRISVRKTPEGLRGGLPTLQDRIRA